MLNREKAHSTPAGVHGLQGTFHITDTYPAKAFLNFKDNVSSTILLFISSKIIVSLMSK
jgi:hypothetical protein